MGAGGFFYKASATLPLRKIYRMSLISAGSISLDSTFKYADVWAWQLELPGQEKMKTSRDGLKQQGIKFMPWDQRQVQF